MTHSGKLTGKIGYAHYITSMGYMLSWLSTVGGGVMWHKCCKLMGLPKLKSLLLPSSAQAQAQLKAPDQSSGPKLVLLCISGNKKPRADSVARCSAVFASICVLVIGTD